MKLPSDEPEKAERKRVEEELKDYTNRLKDSNRMKDLFIDIMRHDLMTPLGVASIYAEFLKENETDEEKRANVEAIKNCLSRAQDLLNRAYRFSRLEAQRSIKLYDSDLKKVIGEVVEDLTPLASKSGVAIENNISKGMHVRANKIIREVFSNLITNAIKYAPEGKRVVIFGEDTGASWRIGVKDFGLGIEDEDKTWIFERLQRKEKEGVKGSGLGLAIAKRIVELHGGRIWVEDNPEGGSIFFVSLPTG
jgi:signal transduction histidine kinase